MRRHPSVFSFLSHTSRGMLFVVVQQTWRRRSAAPCSPCEIIARGVVGGRFPLGTVDLLLLRHPSFISDLCSCVTLILGLDEEEESTGRLNLQVAAKSFESAVGVTILRGQDNSENRAWIDRLSRFVLLERRVKQSDYASISRAAWYRSKSVDVRWCAYQLARFLGSGAPAAEQRLAKHNDRFVALEIYDDVVDQEHRPLWHGADLRGPMSLGRTAVEVGRGLCCVLHGKD